MNKGELIKAMADKAGFTQKDASAAYEAFVESVTDALKAGYKVQLIGFGTIEVKNVAAKKGINPQTKKPVDIPACKKPVMKFGKAYKDSFNN
jgi:DNA-binding protein HU-beta